MSEEYKHETVGFEFEVNPEELEDVVEKIDAFGELARQLKDAELLTSFPGGFCKTVKNVEETAWVEREVPEHLEDAAHDLITTLLKSHGYNSDGEKQDGA